MKCSDAKLLMSSYLDAAVTRSELTAVQDHIRLVALLARLTTSRCSEPKDWSAHWDASPFLPTWR